MAADQKSEETCSFESCWNCWVGVSSLCCWMPSVLLFFCCWKKGDLRLDVFLKEETALLRVVDVKSRRLVVAYLVACVEERIARCMMMDACVVCYWCSEKVCSDECF